MGEHLADLSFLLDLESFSSYGNGNDFISGARRQVMSRRFVPAGVIPACLMPFLGSGEIDEAGYRRHLADLAAVDGVTGITLNGHAAEVHALSVAEQRRAMAVAADAVGGRTALICGVYAESTRLAAELARAAAADGADALLVFPPNSLMFGGGGRPQLQADFVAAVAGATDLPLVVFQYLAMQLHYPLDALVRLCERVPAIAAIKDLGGDPRLHERTIEALHGLARPVNVLTTHSMWLAGSLAMGARGIISGAGSVIADRQVALFRAMAGGGDAQVLRGRVREMSRLVEAFYGHPYVDWQARMKETLARFGRIASGHVRGPLAPLPDGDWRRMETIFGEVGFGPSTLYAMAATA
jgi:4-hydroxy-tetrahydrodipicolinate synthase